MTSILEALEANHDLMREWFEHLHRHPELSMREAETARYIADTVGQWGYEVETGVGKHGIALNCDNDLSPFDLIVPCGIKGHGVTSITQELGSQVSVEDVQPVLVKCFEEVFGFRLEGKSREELLARLHLEAWGTREAEVG